jgi:hypothetical protein
LPSVCESTVCTTLLKRMPMVFPSSAGAIGAPALAGSAPSFCRQVVVYSYTMRAGSMRRGLNQPGRSVEPEIPPGRKADALEP